MLPVSRIREPIQLVGRNADLARLRRAWARACESAASGVLLAGDAGVGKTRLITELLEQVEREGGFALSGHCVGLGQAGPPYLAFFETLDQVQSAAPGVLEQFDLIRTITDAARAVGDRPHDQLQLFEAALGLFTALSEDAPVLWVVEDLHWADASLRDLLTFLLARMNRQRLLVVLTYRADEMHRGHPLRPMLTQLARMGRMERLDLKGFGDEDARSFVRALSRARRQSDSAPPDEKMIDQIAARSEGNAFYAEELLDSPTGALLGPLADVLLSRVDLLAEPAQQVATALAVAGQRSVSHSMLIRILPELEPDILERALRECVDRQLLVPAVPDGYGFRHALLQEALYTDLLPGERTRWHAAYSRALADVNTPGPRGALAHHARKSNNLPVALAAEVQAADEASCYAAPRDELAHLENALSLWDAVPGAEQVTGTDQLTVTLRAAGAAADSGQRERAVEFARAAQRMADAGGGLIARADARRRLAQALYRQFRMEEGREAIRQAWELVEDAPPSPERARVLARMSFDPQDPDRRRFAELAIAEAREVGAVDAEADALVNLAFEMLGDGDAAGSTATLHRALLRATDAGAHHEVLRITFNLAIASFDQGGLEHAAEHARDGLAHAAGVGLAWSPYGRALLGLAVVIHYTRGDWDEAATLSAPGGEGVQDDTSADLAAAAALLQTGRGEFDAVDQSLDRIDSALADHGRQAVLAPVARAERDLWQHRPEAAVDAIRTGLDRLDETEGEVALLAGVRLATVGIAAEAEVAEQARRKGDEASASRAVHGGEAFWRRVVQGMESGEPRADRLGPESLAWFARARAEYSRLHAQHDAGPWREVVEAFGYGEVYQQAIGRWRLAGLLLPQQEGRDALIKALSTAQNLRADPLAEALRSLARRHRVPVPGARATGDPFTPRERAVLELVAEGLTNRAVGTELFISEKTVSVHLSRVMAKLDATSRTEAVTTAIQRGLLDPG